jgi:2'-5' RNA ligase
MRTFLAFEIDEEVMKKVLALTGRLKSIDRSVRWVKPENSHVTIHFFGEIEESNIQRIRGIIKDACTGIEPIPVEMSGISAFPSLERARVIWYGVHDDGRLNTVYGKVYDALKGTDIVEKLERRPYTPHLTAGRVKGRINTKLIEEIRRLEESTFGSFDIRELILFKSTLTGSGPLYDKIERFHL